MITNCYFFFQSKDNLSFFCFSCPNLCSRSHLSIADQMSKTVIAVPCSHSQWRQWAPKNQGAHTHTHTRTHSYKHTHSATRYFSPSFSHTLTCTQYQSFYAMSRNINVITWHNFGRNFAIFPSDIIKMAEELNVNIIHIILLMWWKLRKLI